ncbi:glucosamine-phosphate N-acetyltransferase [Strigomonas culicis]|uniref:Glucosamine 6-phosphate N-acetyltransferase n=1 Tax=Strigomonas culicis TaxID=28005 RepID=S9UGI6_9TRYP|nr:glucosamine-phosphate N-acetyltransferase [Strigomonas culicis]|eukprot:EPY29937.1 glucosamine-phosphate N-acetyltransferase [Strigomonas culicis]
MTTKPDFEIRDVDEETLDALLQLLSHLTEAPPIPKGEKTNILRRRKESNIITRIAFTKDGKLAASASLLVEQKLIRGGRCVGHIEDVVTNPDYRGQGAASKLVQELCEIAAKKNCYKVILDCSESNTAFYEKIGFRVCELQLRKDL